MLRGCCCGGGGRPAEDEEEKEPPTVAVNDSGVAPGKAGELRVNCTDSAPAVPEKAEHEGTTDQEEYQGTPGQEEDEGGGMTEPPATPVGRDELALKRHRFFSDLMAVAEAQTEGAHRVRFDPRGPSFSGIELEERSLSPASPPGSRGTMSVSGYREIVAGPLASYLQLSDKIGGDVAKQAKLVKQAFSAQLVYVEMASSGRKEPASNEQITLLSPTSQGIEAVQEMREKNRASPLFNHLSAISESVPALGWVTVKPAPCPYIKEMSDAGQFYTNRVLKEWREKDKTHVEWVKAWLETLSNMKDYVKQHHTTGLVWVGGGGGGGGGGAPPPPPPPVLPADLDMSGGLDDSGDDRSALFAQINQGENITRSLKKVTSEMQTHKNPSLRTGPAPFKAVHSAAGGNVNSTGGRVPVVKPPVFNRDGKKWLIEHQKGNAKLVVEGAEMNNVVYVYSCSDCTVTVKGKINSVFVDSCRKTSILFDTLVSSIEFVNCHSCQMQVLGKVPTVSIDKTNGCQIFLNKESLGVEIVSSTSTELNVCVPQANGDYSEFPIPEQLKTMINKDGRLETTLVENKG